MKIKLRKLFIYLIIGLFGYWIIPFSARAENGDDVVGNIEAPPWMEKWGGEAATEVGPSFGLIRFFNNVLKLVIIGAGVFALVNLLVAGIEWVGSQGDPEKLKSAHGKIWNSLWGLILIAASFTIAGLAGWILFGDASFIINPKVWGPGD